MYFNFFWIFVILWGIISPP